MICNTLTFLMTILPPFVELSLGKAGEKLETLLKGIMATEVMLDLKGALFAALENVGNKNC